MKKSPQSAGGHARAKSLSRAQRKAQASQAARVRWSKTEPDPERGAWLPPEPNGEDIFGDKPPPDGFVMPTAPEASRPRTRQEFLYEFQMLAKCIDNVLIAHSGLRAALKQPHPPWDAPMDVALRRYGPGPVFSLWCECRAVEALRVAWTGTGTPEDK